MRRTVTVAAVAVLAGSGPGTREVLGLAIAYPAAIRETVADQILADLPQSDRRLLDEQAIQQGCLEWQQAGARGCGTAKVGQQPVLVVIRDLLDPQEPPLGKINERRANVAEDYPAD